MSIFPDHGLFTPKQVWREANVFIVFHILLMLCIHNKILSLISIRGENTSDCCGLSLLTSTIVCLPATHVLYFTADESLNTNDTSLVNTETSWVTSSPNTLFDLICACLETTAQVCLDLLHTRGNNSFVGNYKGELYLLHSVATLPLSVLRPLLVEKI